MHAAAGSVEIAAGNGETYGAGNYEMIRVYGIVQGVGFRPTVSRHAMARGIRGSVSNKGPYVEIFAQGKQQDVDAFIADIGNKPPKRAAILKLLEEPVEEPEKFTQFDIIESEKTKGEIFVSPDIALCDECKAEMFDPENRRYLHPFINCTCCGPRLRSWIHFLMTVNGPV